jgi:hypothetical protein
METNQIHRADETLADLRRICSTSPSFPITNFAWLVACLLILLGAAFELGMLGFGPYNSSGVWLLSVIGQNGWIMLADLAVPQLRELAKIWPLVLVSLGSAIILIARRWNRSDIAVAGGPVTKENNGN